MKRYTRISIILLIFIVAIVTIIFVFPVNGEEEANHTDIKSEDRQAEKIPITDERLYMNIEAGVKSEDEYITKALEVIKGE